MPLARQLLLSVAAVLTILLLADPPAAAQSAYHQLIRPVVQWTFQMGGISTLPAVGADGTIYVGSRDGYLYAIGPDGTVKWRSEIDCCIDPYTSPALGDDGTIYAVGDSTLYALRPDGSLKWTYSVVGRIWCTPALGEDGTIYVEGGVKGSGGFYLYAISAGGTFKWRFSLDATASKARPAIGSGGTIYVAALDGHLYALRPDGSLQWKSRGGYYGSAFPPSIGPDGTIYKTSSADKLHAFYPDGELKWVYNAHGFLSPPVVGAGGIVYVTADSSLFNNYNHLYAIGPDGRLRWKLRIEGGWKSAPVLGTDGRLYIGGSKYLHAIGSATVSAAPQRVVIPDAYELHANYPNPFNPATTISYGLPEAQRVRLEVFDLFGRKVRVLVDGRQTAGWHDVRFDGSGLPSGVYIYRLQAGAFSETRRMMLVK